MNKTKTLACGNKPHSAASLSGRVDDALVKFRQQLGELVSSLHESGLKPSSFEEFTVGLRAASSAVALSALVATIEAADPASATVEHDGHSYRFNDVASKQWLTPFGLETIKRRYYAADDGAGSVVPLDAQCGIRGYVLEEGTYTSTMRVTVSEMRVYRASRPPLPDGGDLDMDMVVNEMDNCQLIANPMQEDINMDGFGDACSLNDPTTVEPTIPDRDGDSIADFADNCVWVANTMQEDVDAGTLLTGIGDACQEEADVMLPMVPWTKDFDVDIVIANGNVTFVIVDFSSDPSDPDAPVTCDPALTMCMLDEDLVEARPI